MDMTARDISQTADAATAEVPLPDGLDGANDALNRMRRANARGTGCHLTLEMVQSLAVTVIGEMWSAEDPRDSAS